MQPENTHFLSWRSDRRAVKDWSPEPAKVNGSMVVGAPSSKDTRFRRLQW